MNECIPKVFQISFLSAKKKLNRKNVLKENKNLLRSTPWYKILDFHLSSNFSEIEQILIMTRIEFFIYCFYDETNESINEILLSLS